MDWGTVLSALLNHVQRMGRDPDLKLVESSFQLLLEVNEEGPVPGQVRHIDEEPR